MEPARENPLEPDPETTLVLIELSTVAPTRTSSAALMIDPSSIELMIVWSTRLLTLEPAMAAVVARAPPIAMPFCKLFTSTVVETSPPAVAEELEIVD